MGNNPEAKGTFSLAEKPPGLMVFNIFQACL